VGKLRCGMQFVPINLYVTVDIVNLLQARTHAPAYRNAHSHGLTAGSVGLPDRAHARSRSIP
jgi:hypothetical protein